MLFFIITLILFNFKLGNSLLQRQFLPTAICADSSPGAYYIERNSSSSDYVVYVAGGGGCADDPIRCEEVDEDKLTSNGLSETITGHGLLSNDAVDNPMYSTFNRIFIHYCTQDMFLLDTESSDGVYQFRGRHLIEETMGLLFGNIDKEASIVLVGSSSGGVGAFNIANWMLDSFKVNELSVIIDGSILVEAGGYMENILQLITDDPSIAYSPYCAEEFRGGPCCIQLTCMIMTEQYPVDRLNTFVIQATQDILPLDNNHDDDGETNPSENIWDAATYTGALDYALNMLTGISPRLSVFSPSCIDHTILLVGGDIKFINCKEEKQQDDIQCVYDKNGNVSGYNERYSLDDDNDLNGMTLTNEVSVNMWNIIQIEGTSIHDAMVIWWEGRDDEQQIVLFDECNDINCNPTCKLSEITPGNRDTDKIIIWVIIVSSIAIAFMILVSCILSITWGVLWTKRVSCMVVETIADPVEYEGDIMSVTDVPVLEWRNLSYWVDTKKTQGNQLLYGVEGSLPKQSFCALIGPSGAGKSTLLDLLTGRRSYGSCSGDVLFNGISVTKEDTKKEYLSKTGYMRQLQTVFFEELSVLNNLVFAVAIRRPGEFQEQIKRIKRSIEMVQLQEHLYTKASNLSGGLKRRLSIAIELLSGKSILFLDEPTSGLDASGSLELMKVLKKLSNMVTIVVTIHQPRQEIWDLFSHSLIVKTGRLIFSGPARDALEGVDKFTPSSSSFSSSSDDSSNSSNSTPDMIMDKVMNINILAIDSTLKRNNFPLIQQINNERSINTKDTKETFMSLFQISAIIISRRWKSGFYRGISFGLFNVILTLCLVGYTLGVSEIPPGILFVTSVIIISFLPVNIVYSAVMMEYMEKTWELIRMELLDGIYRSSCLTYALIMEQIGVCFITSFVVVIVILSMFWRNYIDVSHMGVFFQVFCSLLMFSCFFICVSYSMIISGISSTYVHSTIRSLTSIWCFYSGTLFSISSLPMFLKLITYTSPFYWFSNFVLRVILDGIYLSSDCSRSSNLYCVSDYGDVIGTKIEIHRRPQLNNLVVISTLALVGIIMLFITIKIKSRKVHVLDCMNKIENMKVGPKV